MVDGDFLMAAQGNLEDDERSELPSRLVIQIRQLSSTARSFPIFRNRAQEACIFGTKLPLLIRKPIDIKLAKLVSEAPSLFTY
jgi:hypothetical protein